MNSQAGAVFRIGGPIARTAAWVVLALALVTLLGWLGNMTRLVQLSPGLAPMQFNTAMGLMLAAAALIAVQHGAGMKTAVLLVPVFWAALLTLAQYVLRVDLGLDEALWTHTIVDQTGRPGRMAPATAMALMLASSAIGCVWRAQSQPRWGLWAQASSGIAALITIEAMLKQVNATWHAGDAPFTTMAPQTALAVLLLVAAIFGSVGPVVTNDNLMRLERRGAWLVCMLIAMSYLLWQSLERQQLRDQMAITGQALRTAQGELSGGLAIRADALLRLAQDWDVADPPTQQQWERRALRLLRDFPALNAVILADTNYVVRWRVGRDGVQRLVGTSLGTDQGRAAVYQAATESGLTRLTPALTLRSGGRGTVFVAPVLDGRRVLGFVTTSIRIEDLLRLLSATLRDEFVITLHQGQERIASNRRGEESLADHLTARASLQALGQQWMVELVPRQATTDRLTSRLPEAVLLFGLIASALIATVFHHWRLAMVSRQQADTLAHRLGSTLESITDAFFTLDREWHFSYVNAEAERMLLCPRGSLLGRNIWEAFPAARAEGRFHQQYERVMNDRVRLTFEEFSKPSDLWLEVNAYPSDEGIAVYSRDITQRRADEAQLRLLKAAVERLNDIVLITESDPIDEPGPRVVFVNEAFERITGYARSDILGCSPRLLQGVATARVELDRIRSAMQDGREVQAELVNYTKAGKEFRLDLDIMPLRDVEGTITHWVSIERDVTQQRALEDQLRQSQRLESVGQLTGGVAHDFNNLLTVILGNAELLAGQLEQDGSQRALAEMILGAANRGAELTQRLLAFARKQALDPKVVDINLQVAELDQLLRRALGEHIEIEFVRGTDLWSALVDPAQLENALLNLCLNARDAMPHGGRLTIESANVSIDTNHVASPDALGSGDYVMLAISDTGSGIAPDDLARVFEPFYTTKEKGKGTGLGLAMVWGFVKQTGGHATVYSEPGHGTTVKLYLPRAQAPTPTAALRAPEGPIVGGNETILMVEDDAFVRRYAQNQLHTLGYTVLTADNGHQALEILREHRAIDLLFTDVVMPGMGGRELADQARALRPGLRVLYTSGYTENAIVHHGRLDPGVMLLGKPYRRADMARKVREALGHA